MIPIQSSHLLQDGKYHRGFIKDETRYFYDFSKTGQITIIGSSLISPVIKPSILIQKATIVRHKSFILAHRHSHKQ